MKKSLLLLTLLFLIPYCSFSQGVGIGTTTPDASAALDITATNNLFSVLQPDSQSPADRRL